ncbi:AAA family ATPase [Roseivivax marinus]|uniref:AAA family ATPase n=1 Tax=Roseivivax marinus TaxID=1379903 RepID=UPI00273E74C3|nr:AAA family ATPase [Roseivivax marinus]
MTVHEFPTYPEQLRKLEADKRAEKEASRKERWALAAFDDEVKNVANALPGTRNNTLNTAALKLAHKVAAGLLDESKVFHRLLETAKENGLPPNEAHATLVSAFMAGKQEPEYQRDRADFRPMQSGTTPLQSFTARERRLPTEFVWHDPATIPPRPWVYGHHLIRKQVSVTVAPGGIGKSSLTIAEALAMASGRELLGDWIAPGLKVWLYNLEDPHDEMDRRIIAAMQHHHVSPAEIAGRLYVDTGRERALSTAIQTREGVHIVQPELDALAAEVEARQIDVLVIDPFVSSHQTSENDNGAIDLVAKEWARLADRCNCAIELVHHTRKTNGEEATTESARGASALLAAARSGRVLNKMGDDLKAEAGVQDDPATYFAVTRDKSNLAPAGNRKWRRMASVHLANGDSVGVAEVWEWPDTFDGISVNDLLAVQHAIQKRHDEGNAPGADWQTKQDWAGVIVAKILGLNAEKDRNRIIKILKTWEGSGALRRVDVPGPQRRQRKGLEVGEWAMD